MIRYVMVGYGWRAQLFYDLAKYSPDKFEVTAGVVRSQERIDQIKRERGIYATTDMDEALKTNPDFVVLCIPRAIMKDYTIKMMEKGIPVMCETPPGKNVEELNELYKKQQELNGKVQVLEQYHLWPFYKALQNIVLSGLIGPVQNITLSALHGYHAISIFRKILGLKMENCTIFGQQFISEVTKTNSRDGFSYNGEVLEQKRDLVTFSFDNNKAAIFDFTSHQYFSTIRTRRINIQGVRGEINDMTVRYLNKDNKPVQEEINQYYLGLNNISGWCNYGVSLGDKILYENPTMPARLNDDEISVADSLIRMKEYLENGAEEVYALKDGLQDAYLSFLMEESIRENRIIRSETQSWG
ncbi:MAG: dehydrogenase [Candidatus Epulonipiscioides saccharophilum]|nr:MAG: dehydrogenase [Epulopiscium sp. AS2M-Bin001]